MSELNGFKDASDGAAGKFEDSPIGKEIKDKETKGDGKTNYDASIVREITGNSRGDEIDNLPDVDDNSEKAEKKDTSKTKDTDGKELARTPTSNGSWEGERGYSKWIPDGEYTPPEKSPEGKKPYSNPEQKKWSELLDKYGIDGIEFNAGYPVFSPVSKADVKIDGFKTGGAEAKNVNFAKADINLAKQKECSPEDVAKWRKDNNYTWHECEDKKTMQKVPNEIHANIPHDGGRSQD